MPKIPFKQFRLNLLKNRPIHPEAKMHRMGVYDFGEEAKGVDLPKEIRKIIKTHYSSYPAYEINCGSCGEVADAIVQKFGGKMIETPPKSGLPGHAWVLWNGKHYDAENPNGVTDWKKLKFFRRLWNTKLAGYGIDRMKDK